MGVQIPPPTPPDLRYAEDQSDPDARDIRYITEISLHKGDVSVVNYGANPNASFQINDDNPTPTRHIHDETITDEPPQQRPRRRGRTPARR